MAAEPEHNIKRMLKTTWETKKNLLWYFWHFSVVIELFELFPCSDNDVCQISCAKGCGYVCSEEAFAVLMTSHIRVGSGIERLVQKQIVRNLSSGLNHCLCV